MSAFRSRRFGLSLFLGTAVCFAIGSTVLGDASESDSKPQLEAVEPDVHEFMEYAFDPVFKVLKATMQSEPQNRKGWVPLKSTALLLAENGNLLMLRAPEENSAEWNKLSAELRQQGKPLYQAAKKRDFDATRKEYKAIVANCNACHQSFADGEHMLEP